MTKRKIHDPFSTQHETPAPAEAPANPAHEMIRAHLARIGVTGEDDVASALDAHEAGVDMMSLINDIKAGMPHWLAVVYALTRHLHGDQAAGSSPSGSGQSPGGTGGGGT